MFDIVTNGIQNQIMQIEDSIWFLSKNLINQNISFGLLHSDWSYLQIESF